MRMSDWSSDVCSSDRPGGLNESDVFAAKGMKDGSPLTLTVRRRRYPGEGWLTEDVTGRVLAARAYSYPTGQAGRAWCRARVGPSVSISMVGVILKNERE